MKTEQAVQELQAFAFCIVNVNSSVGLKHFEYVKDLIILSILKEKLGSFYLKIVYKAFWTTVKIIAMISKGIIKFGSKFQFQIPLKIYRTVQTIETCNGNGGRFWQVLPSFQPSHFSYYFVFSGLRFKHTQYKGTLTKFPPKRT